jgi:hypothetical protein
MLLILLDNMDLRATGVLAGYNISDSVIMHACGQCNALHRYVDWIRFNAWYVVRLQTLSIPDPVEPKSAHLIDWYRYMELETCSYRSAVFMSNERITRDRCEVKFDVCSPII